MLTIDIKALKALSAFASAKDTRHYLRGVHIEATPGQVIYVAADDHRMAVLRQEVECGEQWCGEIIIPTETIKTFRFGKRDEIGGHVWAVLAPSDGGRFTLNGIGLNQAVTFAPVDGTFPDWRKIVPIEYSEAPTMFNWSYMADFQKFATALDLGRPVLTSNGESAAMVNFGNEDAFGVLMPMRGYHKTEGRPEWIGTSPKMEAAA